MKGMWGEGQVVEATSEGGRRRRQGDKFMALNFLLYFSIT